MSSKTRTIAASPTARKVVGSLGVLGTAAAVAGMGTFGGFTDSTTPVATTIESGTLSINLSQQGYAVPVTTAGFLPGDSITRAVNLVNDGNSALGSVSLSSVATASSVLTTDLSNGLQLAVKKCSVAWTQGGTAQAPTYTCSGTETLVGSGPAVNNMAVNGAAALNPGGTDHLTFSISLPGTADNTFQGKTASLSLTFTGTQRTGTAR
ncbi:MAG TPA: TasA family protein [Microlunatus sp.]|nr:TasA family protein [Microlunatus sp.]